MTAPSSHKDVPKRCFVISPIGDAGSDVRKRADQILKYVIQPAVAPFGYTATRADAITEPGLITSQVIDRVINDQLVVADLTGRNPNVYHELAIRHAIRKPFVQLIAAGEPLPFDIVGMRTVTVDHRDLDSVAQAVRDLANQIETIEQNPSAIQTPISVTVDVTTLRQSTRPEDRLLADVMSTLNEVNGRLAELQLKGDNVWTGSSARPLVRQRRGPRVGNIEIVAEEGNRRDARLWCGYCGEGPIPMHFFEGAGAPKLGTVLGLFHYRECPGAINEPIISLRLTAFNREPVDYIWHRARAETGPSESAQPTND